MLKPIVSSVARSQNLSLGKKSPVQLRSRTQLGQYTGTNNSSVADEPAILKTENTNSVKLQSLSTNQVYLPESVRKANRNKAHQRYVSQDLQTG